MLFDFTCESLGINDPYVSERMLAASYGVAMARCMTADNKAFIKTVLPAFARQIYDLMFKNKAVYGTTHLLSREYARSIIELAAFYHRQLFSAAEQKRFRPPYKSGGCRVWEKSKTLKTSSYGYDTPFLMDFENYTLGHLVSGRGNYDFEHPDYKQIRSQVLWRVEQLGWSKENFKELDCQIVASHRGSRIEDGRGKTDRYGKKYSWIAYYEMAGLQQDKGKIEREEDGRTWDVDIDPSFPLPLPDAKPFKGDYLGDYQLTRKQWICDGPVPDLKSNLRINLLLEQKGPWVALDGFFSQQGKERGRRLFCFVRSFMVSKKDANEFIKYLRRQDLAGRWLPEKPSVTYAFAGEIPWGRTCPENGITKFNFVTKEYTKKVRRKCKAYFLDGKQIPVREVERLTCCLFGNDTGVAGVEAAMTGAELARIETRDVVVSEDVICRETESFNTLIPVRDFSWEGQSLEGESVHGVTLSREIARDLQLVGRPQTLDMFVKSGEKATIGVSDREDYNNSQQLFVMREDLLKCYLAKSKRVMVWAIWGEREFSPDVLNELRSGANYPDPLYKVYQIIKKYPG